MWISLKKWAPIHICLLLVFFGCQGLAINTPPHLSFEREWILTENEPIGNVVARINVKDTDGDVVNVSIGLPSSVVFQKRRNDGHTFFIIDEDNKVILKKSLAGMAGETFLVGVIASDGNVRNRVDAKVTVRRPNETIRIPSYNNLANSFDPGPPPPLDGPTSSFSDEVGPPLIHLDPFTIWSVPNNASPGSFVAKVEATDLSNSFLRFSLLPGDLLNINTTTGDVTVANSLLDKIGKHKIQIEVSAKDGSITEDVTLNVVPASDDGSTSSKVRKPTTFTSILTNTEINDVTTVTPIVTVIEQVIPKETKPSTESQETLGWTVVLLVLLFGVVPITLVGVFLFWKWQRKKKAKAATKESSVSYTEKRDSMQSHEGSGRRESIIEGIFSIVGIHKRAENNGYEEDVTAPKVPSRDSKKPLKSLKSNTVIEEPDKWEFSRHKLRVLGILGEGCFGQVWKCEATNLKDEGPTIVAVKTLKESAGAEEQKDLLQELKVLKNLGYHPNVVALLGCCTEKEPMFVILEYMIGGKLQSYLRSSRAGQTYNNLHGVSATLTPRDLTIFALQVAKGMDFLSKHGIIHRDLAARNVLIGEDKVCKVADFGFARDITNNSSYERKSDGRLPIRWMAPESLFDNIFTTKSDVWSFGILLWEIVTLGSTPYPGMSAPDVMRRVKDGYRLEKPNHCRREVYNIMYYCWDIDQIQRPSFSELVQTLEKLIMTEVEYIHLDNFPDRNYYNFSSGAVTGELL